MTSDFFLVCTDNSMRNQHINNLNLLYYFYAKIPGVEENRCSKKPRMLLVFVFWIVVDV